jgi:hypothetical protein
VQLIRALLDNGDGGCTVAFCILFDSTCACQDPSQSNMCILAARMHLEPKIQSGRKPVHFHPVKPPALGEAVGGPGSIQCLTRFYFDERWFPRVSLSLTRLIFGKPCLHSLLTRPQGPS